MTNTEQILSGELPTELADTITLSSASDSSATNWNWHVGTGNYDSMTSSITSSTVTGSAYNSPYTVNSGTNSPWMTSTVGQMSAPKIQLDGEGADIQVNGWSLVDAVKRIEERLAIMQPNPNLEKEWTELKQLGDQYRALEQHILDKQATWDRLKAMPPPIID